MDFSKPFPLLKNFSTYSSHKGRVVYGFCLEVVVSIVVLSLIASINTTMFTAMDFSKPFPLLKNFSTYSSHKGLVVYGFCLEVVVTIVVFFLIASINTTMFSLTGISTTANSSSVLPRSFSPPGNSSRGNLDERETGLKDLQAVESNVTALNSSRGNLYGRETGLKDLHAIENDMTTLNSSRGTLYGKEAGLKDLHAIRSNVTA